MKRLQEKRKCPPPIIRCRNVSALAGLAVLVGVLAVPVSPPARAQASGQYSGRTGETIPLRGVVRAVRQASISTESALRAIKLPFRDGQRFQHGSLLAEFDCSRQHAEYETALAQQREADLHLKSNQHLDRLNAVGRLEVEIAKVRREKAASEAVGLKARLDECRIVAPFSGRVVELSLQAHERTVPQRPFITIIDDGELEIELIAPSSMLKELQHGRLFRFVIDETGLSIRARLDRVGAAIDPVSKTVKLMAIPDRTIEGLLAGMSGSADFSGGSAP